MDSRFLRSRDIICLRKTFTNFSLNKSVEFFYLQQVNVVELIQYSTLFFHSTNCFAYMRNISATSVIACFCEVPSTQGRQKAGDVIEFDREHTFFTFKYFHRSNNHWTPCKRHIPSICEMIGHFSEVEPYSI